MQIILRLAIKFDRIQVTSFVQNIVDWLDCVNGARFSPELGLLWCFACSPPVRVGFATGFYLMNQSMKMTGRCFHGSSVIG